MSFLGSSYIHACINCRYDFTGHPRDAFSKIFISSAYPSSYAWLLLYLKHEPLWSVAWAKTGFPTGFSGPMFDSATHLSSVSHSVILVDLTILTVKSALLHFACTDLTDTAACLWRNPPLTTLSGLLGPLILAYFRWLLRARYIKSFLRTLLSRLLSYWLFAQPSCHQCVLVVLRPHFTHHWLDGIIPAQLKTDPLPLFFPTWFHHNTFIIEYIVNYSLVWI